MLDKAQIDEVVRLLATGLSQRQVAKRTGVSRGTIHAIAAGKRGHWGWEDGDDRNKRSMSEVEKLRQFNTQQKGVGP